MANLITAAGVLLIGTIIWEVFKDLFHPAHRGALSEWIGRGIFNALRRSPSVLPFAGPLAVVSVIAAWVLLLVAGFAFVYYGYFPAQFQTSMAQTPPGSARALTVPISRSRPWLRSATAIWSRIRQRCGWLRRRRH
jgi:hypothetical protein